MQINQAQKAKLGDKGVPKGQEKSRNIKLRAREYAGSLKLRQS